MSDVNETDELLHSLQARASASPNVPSEEDTSPAEDIDAFLADLEGGDASSTGASSTGAADSPPRAAEPDPFADAFASLEEAPSDEVPLDEAALAARLAALAPKPQKNKRSGRRLSASIPWSRRPPAKRSLSRSPRRQPRPSSSRPHRLRSTSRPSQAR